MSKYIIWDKRSSVVTPVGTVFSAEEWMDRYPVSKIETLDLVLSGESAVNGALCNEYTSFVSVYRQQGCDFEGCETKQDYLDRIEQFEIERNEAAANYISDETRTADALEDLVVLTELAQA